jgi:maltose O-acetyltransferase
MNRIKKIRIIFSFYFWKQIYLLIASFLTGNVWARSRLGSYEDIDIHPTVRFGNSPENIFFNKNISVGYGTHIYAGKDSKIFIGDNTMIGPFVFITTEAFSESKENPNNAHSGHVDDIYIGYNVRIGAHAVLLPGSKIGDGSSIGAGSVVNSEVPSNTIFAGNPAKFKKNIE